MSFNFRIGGQRVMGGANAAKGGCGAIFAVLFGLLLVPLGLFLVYFGEMRLVNHGIVFANTVMTTADGAAKSPEKLVKFKAKPKGKFLRVERYDKPALYWHTQLEEYQSERDSEGRVEYEWNSVGGETHWADFSLGPVKIIGEKANAVGERTVFTGVKKSSSRDFSASLASSSPSVGDRRLTLKVIDADREIIVLGQVTNGCCQGGSSFVISGLDEAGTEKALRTEYKILYWVLKGGAVFVMWFGLLAIFGPLMNLVGWIPFLGERLSGAMAFGALLFSLVVVGLVTVAVKFFWIILALVAAVIVLLVWRGLASPRERPVAAV